MTMRTRPVADSTAPTVSNGRVGSGGSGSSMWRLSTMIRAMIRAWNTKAARQLSHEVMSPPMSRPAAAPMPPSAMMTPKARAREVMSSKRSVVRM